MLSTAFLGITAAAGILLALLQLSSVATPTAQFLADIANPLEGTEISIGEVQGSWVASLELVNVSITRTDSVTGERLEMAHVDTLSTRYDMSDLTSGQLTLRNIRIAGPRATLRQAADSTWDWIRVLPPPSTDTTTSNFIVRVEDAVISRGAASAQFYTPASDASAPDASALDSIATDAIVTDSVVTDSVATIDDLYVSLPLLESNAALGGLGLHARLDTLGLRARAPGDTTQLVFGTRLDLSPSRLQLDTLALDSPRSRVTGKGVARLPSGPGDVLSDVDLQLSARPLSFLDLVPLLPAATLDPAEEVDGILQLTGSGDELQARLDASFQDGGQVDLRSSFTPRIEAPEAEPSGGLFSQRAGQDTSSGPALRYAVDARIQDLTTSLIGVRDSLTNQITARFQADLSGASLSELSGSITAAVDDTRYGVTRADSVRLRATLNRGSTTYDLTGRVNGATLDGSGRAEPFADMPTYELAASFRELDAEAFGAAGFPTQMNGRLTLDGRGASASTVRASTQLMLEPSVVNDLSIRAGEASLTLVPDSAAGRVEFTTPNGRFLVVGMTQLDSSERFRVDTARVDNIDVADLMADTTDSRLQLTGQAAGRGFDPATMEVNGSVDITDSFYGTVQLDSLRSEVSLARGDLSAMLRAAVNDGQIELTASGRPFDSPLTVTVEQGRFRRIDIGKWSEGEAATSDLNGSFSASMTGGRDLADPATLTAAATVRLDSSRINKETVRSATVNGSLTRGTVNADASLTLPSGTSSVIAMARPFDDVPEIRITDGTIRGVNVGRLAAVDGLDTDLSGSVTGSARGTDLASLDGRATLQFADSRINRAPLDQARLTMRIRDGTAQMQLRSRLAGGGITANGTLAVDSLQTSGTDASAASPPDSSQTRLQLAIEAATLDLADIAGSDSTNARLDSLRWTFDGSGETLETLTAETELALRGVTAADLDVRSIDLRGRLDEGLLRVDTLVARSNAAQATGGGTIAFLDKRDTASSPTDSGSEFKESGSEFKESDSEFRESDFRFTAVATNLPALRALTGAESLDADTASVDGRIYGSPGNLRFGLEGELRGLVYDNIRLAKLTVRAAGRQGDSTLIDRVEATLNANTFTADAVQVDQTKLNVVYDSSRADVTLQTRIDDRRSANIEADLDPRAGQQSVTLRTFSATINDNSWELLQEATLFYGDAYRIRGLLLYSNDQQIAADGRLDPNGTQSLVATIENFRVASVADLAGVDGLGGTLSGTMSFSGPADSPRLDGRLVMNVESNQEEVGDLRVNIGYDSLRVDVDATLTHTDDTELTAKGYLPADLRLNAAAPAEINTRPVDFTVQTEHLPINWIDPFLDPQLVRDPTGRLQADIQIGGTIRTPEIGGTAKLRDGGVRIYDLDVSYERASADIGFDGERIVLSNTRVYDQSGGRLEASGFINLAELTVGEYDLDLDARNFVAIDTRAYKDIRIDGDLVVTGTTEEPVVRGDITVIQGDIFYTETLSEAEAASLATVQLTEQDRRLLEQRFSVRLTEADTTTFDAYQAMEMEMSVNIRRDTWLRSRANPELNIQFTGTLDLEKGSGEDARVFGAIDVVPERSTVRQFGQEFRIQEGTLSFNGNPEEPYLNFIAVYEKQSRQTNSTEVEITLSAQGRPEDLDLQLSSQPQMDTRNILSYLATGQPADQLLSGGGGSTTDLAENLAIGQLTSLAENFATSNVGLDVVRIQYQPDGGSYFVLGRYVTPRFYVAIEQPVAVNQNQQGSGTSSLAPDLTLEYELTDNLLMRAQSRQQSLRFNLLFEYAY